jgi:hypothetical protein
MSVLKKYGYLWVTGLFFLVSITLQWLTHDGTTAGFVNAVMENWQSEFLQLIWQVGGLMFLYAWGSQQSRDEQERLDAKLEAIHEEIRDMRLQQNPAGEPSQFRPLASAPKPKYHKPHKNEVPAVVKARRAKRHE